MKIMNVVWTCIVLISLVIVVSSIDEDRKVFIAYMGFLPEGEYSPSLHHYEILKNITNPRFARKSLIRSYQRSFNGFAAYLSQEEQQNLAGFDGIISVFPCQKLHLQTTRSWDFMGFPTTIERSPTAESDTIIGVIDGGIWPDSESFNDDGLGPIPERWKGECQGGTNFTCSRKIIGARYYGVEYSVRDMHGHGTHVASTIAGRQVNKASYYGLAQGTARGGVPSARLAVYKACDVDCNMRDILTAFDDAISDGVDIISISVGSNDPLEFTSDPIAIGAFHAMQSGILTVNAAGNAGPGLYTVTGDAPWIFAVAASNTDRRIVTKVLLGDGTILMGNSINAFPSSKEELPLLYGKQVTSECSENEASYCHARCLDGRLVEQKVVLCDENRNTDSVKVAGAIGCIVPDHGKNVSEVEPFPIAALNTNDINLVKTYQNSTRSPKVQIFKSQAINNQVAPIVASFSSRGPSKFISDILKPDITAPGVEIMAAYSPMASPSHTHIDKSSVKYNILSGTSMACPHVAAAAAFVKSFHPNWSPSAIKSALMTTAWEMNPNRSLDAVFAYGSGHIDPHKAKDPGLVYDTSKEDYHKIWCNISRSINATCHANLTIRQLNYPSMAAQVDVNTTFVVSFPRTVTNVGKAYSKYVASIKGGTKLDIIVDPDNLQFTSLNQRMSFVVTVTGKGIQLPLTVESVLLLWTDEDDTHKVRSPIVVYTGNTTNTTCSDHRASTSPKFCKNFLILFVGIIIVIVFM
ncbi:unnamed protein product [Lactuca saligna]|uniref:Cucumisin n=1 Tax=Lactuca saligna TaxID=75948 RepID=A0AA35YQE8_LACSI|nr:unnamed protein product [Lactuca saligna]